ncbi:hypothetical protein FE392_15895 [Xenorhabdus sp. 12]|uniref:DUF5625 domain-containing protein n=1 Tax=Xenorhabdus santafensis TaxID=2582833 RepID=A0ABU4SD97_9GAMM|nr:DUF5625 family protein [Xenorhabdus sp. 12]MDX7988788.1 hypothetical protein [Xenorhabdus sp. 12]
MKVLQVHEKLGSWCKVIIFLSCIWLVACSNAKPIDIYKPIDVTRSGQSVKINFEIIKTGNYQFSLLFDKGNDYEEIIRRIELFGNADKEGIITPVLLHIVKDGAVFFDEKISAGGRGWGQYLDYGGRRINIAVRNIKILELPPGSYSAVITTLGNIPDFNEIESFVEFAYFSPKI